MNGGMIQLGNRIRDKVTGVEGIATSRTEFLNGCIRYTLQPKPLKKDGAIPAELWFDEKQLELVGDGIAKDRLIKSNTGGPVSRTVPKGLRA